MSEDGSTGCLTKSRMMMRHDEHDDEPEQGPAKAHPTDNGAFGLWFLADTRVKVFMLILSHSLPFYTSLACLFPLPAASLVSPPPPLEALRNGGNCQAKGLPELLARSMCTLLSFWIA